MYNQSLILTMSHVGLGGLTESSLMTLFGDVHSHNLVDGLSITPSNIRDNKGLLLYPAYFMTHLKVPLAALLSQHHVWDEIQLGVDVSRFGGSILDSNYILTKPEIDIENTDSWDIENNPTMHANNVFVVDDYERIGPARQVSIPQKDCIAELPKLTKAPQSLLRAKQVRQKGFEFEQTLFLHNHRPIQYRIKHQRDAVPGHALMFSKLCQIMDVIETQFLQTQLHPGLMQPVLETLALLERETYYYRNVFNGDELQAYLRYYIAPYPEEKLSDEFDSDPIGLLKGQISLYQKGTNHLVTLSKVTKTIVVKQDAQDLQDEVNYLIKHYNNEVQRKDIGND